MREIKFRIWDKERKEFYTTENYPTSMNDRGCLVDELYSTDFGWFFNGLLSIVENDRFIVQQFTGITDSAGTPIYESDVVEINYYVGDQAWENMTPEEVEKNKNMVGNKYLCTVEWNDHLAGFYLIYGKQDSTHIQFPLCYAKYNGGLVKGNIFECKTS